LKNLIYLCACSDISTGGGLETYVSSLASYGMPEVSKDVITSLEGIDQSQFKLLHVQEEMALRQILQENVLLSLRLTITARTVLVELSTFQPLEYVVLVLCPFWDVPGDIW
jgi:hypothetical protein